jgi:hypothetical protein
MNQEQSPRLAAELPQATYNLVQRVGERVGLVASCSLTSFLFGEITHLVGVSKTEVDLIRDYAKELHVDLPKERFHGGLIHYPRRE